MTSRYEREIIDALEQSGWACMRAPASGSATTRDLPDVLAGKRQDWRDHLDPIADAGTENRSHTRVTDAAAVIGTLSQTLAIEHKSTSATTAYVEAAEVEALQRFAKQFGAKARLAVRFTTQASPTAHYLVAPADARMTDAGTFGLPLGSIEERASEVVETGEDAEVRRI